MTNYVFANYLDAVRLVSEVESDNIVGIPQGIAPNAVSISNDSWDSSEYGERWIVSVG